MRSILIVLAILAGGCASPEFLESPRLPADESVAVAAAGYGRAFGRVEWIDRGGPVALGYGLLSHDALTLYFRSAQTREMRFVQVDSDGSFYLPLLAGDHVLVAAELSQQKGAVTIWRTRRVMAAFSVPAAGQAVYLGDLRLGRDYRVVDDFEPALQKVKEKLAEGKFEPVKALARFERPIGRYSRAIDVCQSRWVVSCGGTYRGVEAVQPLAVPATLEILPSGNLQPAIAESLTPLLEWKPPPSRAPIAYDVVVFESLALMFTNVPGAVIAYAEGLADPRYVTPPLEPHRRYYWSVRLRDGDVVSSWSAVAHASRGGGYRPFSFETPDTGR